MMGGGNTEAAALANQCRGEEAIRELRNSEARTSTDSKQRFYSTYLQAMTLTELGREAEGAQLYESLLAEGIMTEGNPGDDAYTKEDLDTEIREVAEEHEEQHQCNY